MLYIWLIIIILPTKTTAMKRFQPLLLVAFISIMVSATSKAQETNPFQNRVINKYYSTEKLTQLQQNSYAEFKRVKYYFIHSFTLTNLNCATCPAFLPQIFDVSKYEHLRLQNTTVEFVDSTKNAKIVLISKNQLAQMIADETIPKVTADNTKFATIHNAPYPTLTLTNNIENDIATFKTQLKEWAKYNPIAYYNLKANKKKVFEVEELLDFPTDRVQHIIDHPQLYVIISNNL